MEQFCEVAKGFKDLWFLTNYSLLKFAFFNPFLGQTQTAEARGKPWSLTWKKNQTKPSETCFTSLMWAKSNQKVLTAF